MIKHEWARRLEFHGRGNRGYWKRRAPIIVCRPELVYDWKTDMIKRLVTVAAAAALFISTTAPSFAHDGWHGGGWHGGSGWHHHGGGWGVGPAIGLGVGLGLLGAAVATAPYSYPYYNPYNYPVYSYGSPYPYYSYPPGYGYGPGYGYAP